jgi:serine/threonine protein kinase
MYSQGTPSYRAPELLTNDASFTNKVDIWALGCILHELATGRVAFSEDWTVRQYALTDSDLPISIHSLPEFLQHQVVENIQHLIHRERTERPRASVVCQILRSYCQLLSLSCAEASIYSQSYPSYAEWTQLLNKYPNGEVFLYQLTDVFEKKEEQTVAMAIRQELIQNEASRRYESQGERNFTLRECLADVYFEKSEYNLAAQQYEIAIKEDPENFWACHSFCRVHMALYDLDHAIAACQEKAAEFLDSLSIRLQLCIMYAAKEDYRTAIREYMELSERYTNPSPWDNVSLKSSRKLPSQ